MTSQSYEVLKLVQSELGDKISSENKSNIEDEVYKPFILDRSNLFVKEITDEFFLEKIILDASEDKEKFNNDDNDIGKIHVFGSSETDNDSIMHMQLQPGELPIDDSIETSYNIVADEYSSLSACAQLILFQANLSSESIKTPNKSELFTQSMKKALIYNNKKYPQAAIASQRRAENITQKYSIHPKNSMIVRDAPSLIQYKDSLVIESSESFLSPSKFLLPLKPSNPVPTTSRNSSRNSRTGSRKSREAHKSELSQDFILSSMSLQACLDPVTFKFSKHMCELETNY